MEKSFASFLVEPIPVEKKLSTELKIREILHCDNIEALKVYTIHLLEQNVNNSYVLTHALVKILEKGIFECIKWIKKNFKKISSDDLKYIHRK